MRMLCVYVLLRGGGKDSATTGERILLCLLGTSAMTGGRLYYVCLGHLL